MMLAILALQRRNYKMDKVIVKASPGEQLSKCIEAAGWAQQDLAEIINLPPKTISLLIQNKQAISPDIAIRLGKVFDISADKWLNLQSQYQLQLERNAATGSKEELIDLKTRLYKIMPVAELKKKGWFKNDINTVQGIKNECKRLFGQESIPENFEDSLNKYCARQNRYDKDYTNKYGKIWYTFAILHSQKFELPQYDEKKLHMIANRLNEYTLQQDGIKRIIEDLNNAGVGFFVLKHLEKTYLDGATFLRNGNPFIVYTGRYNRIDNFWFVIAHEIAHIMLHFNLLQTPIFDDLHSSAQDKIEKEADEKASTFLHKETVISEGKKYKQYLSDVRLEEVSNAAGIAKPVALGLLQHEGIVEWRKFTKLKTEVVENIPKEFVMG